jgi:hypothetical protein
VKIPRSETESSSQLEYSHERTRRVILWDERRDRQLMISKIIRGADVHPVVLEALSDLYSVKLCGQCSIAVVAADSQSDDVGIRVIRDLKAKDSR